MSISDSNKNKSKVYTFGKEKFSKYQPIDVKPLFGRLYVTNGVNNRTFNIFKDAYDDSPTNASIINAYCSYIFGEGLVDINGSNIDQYISQEDAQMAVQDLKIYGGMAFTCIWNSSEIDRKPLKLEYIPIVKLAINYDNLTQQVNGYWYSYDWERRATYAPRMYPKFTGEYTEGQGLEIIYVRRPTSETFFPIPDYLSGVKWAQCEGEISNAALSHFLNGLGELTVINYNGGEAESAEVAKLQADKTRLDITGTSENGKVVISYNESAEYATTVDRIAPAEMSEQNIFYSEKATEMLIIAHSAPPILFQGKGGGNGFSSNADEREIAMKDLYRRNINPFRNTFFNGLYEVFQLIDPLIKLDFKDFDSEDKLDVVEDSNTQTNVNPLDIQPTGNALLDEKTLSAQASLKGSVGGVQALLDIQASYGAGTTSYESAISMLDIIFGYNQAQAVSLLGTPKTETDGTDIIT
jgi:hypothetical protein